MQSLSVTAKCLFWLCRLDVFVGYSTAATCSGVLFAVPDTVWPESCHGASDGTVCAGDCRPGRGGRVLPTSTCLNGMWSKPVGRCSKVSTGAPPSYAGANWDNCTGVTLVGERCTGSCPPAAPNGKPSIVCSGGGWDTSSAMGRCTANTVCSSPPPMAVNAVWDQAACQDTAVGSTCPATCRSGYGPGVNATCNAGGQKGLWTLAGMCTKVCTEPLPEVPGVVWDAAAVGATPVGKTAAGGCAQDTPFGGVTIRCISSGWDPDSIVGRCSSTPVCMLPPPRVINGKIPSSCIGTPVGESCIPGGVRPGLPSSVLNSRRHQILAILCILCNQGYYGDVRATCAEGGNWIIDGSCVRVYQGDEQALFRALQENPNIATVVNVGWNAQTPLCVGPPTVDNFWTGVFCLDPVQKPGVVGGLYLDQSGIAGPLPPSIGDLLEVGTIQLSFNYFTGPLPASWGKLRSLRVLLLNENRQPQDGPGYVGLSGTIPAAWASMTNLEALFLSGNNLEGAFPTAFKSLTKLAEHCPEPQPWWLPTSKFQDPGVLHDFTGLGPTRRNAMQWTVGSDREYGRNGAVLYTGSGPLWRTQVINWEGMGNNSASNPDPQPPLDICTVQTHNPLCL